MWFWNKYFFNIFLPFWTTFFIRKMVDYINKLNKLSFFTFFMEISLTWKWISFQFASSIFRLINIVLSYFLWTASTRKWKVVFLILGYFFDFASLLWTLIFSKKTCFFTLFPVLTAERNPSLYPAEKNPDTMSHFKDVFECGWKLSA